MVGKLSAASRRNLQAYAEAHNRGLAIVKKLRDAGGKDGSNTDQKVTYHYQPASKIGQTHAMLGFPVGGFHFINKMEQEGFSTMLKVFSCNLNLSIMDLRSTGNLVHEAFTRAHKRLR